MKVAVAISAFRSDSASIELLSQIARERWPVDVVLVVDSLGSGEIERFVRANDPAIPVLYQNSESNLGSAGNLQRRLEWAAALGMDVVWALNHDARVTGAVLEGLLAQAEGDMIGALYPLKYRAGKRLFDLTGTAEFSFRSHGTSVPPAEALVEVFWSSSNGALYSTAPLRDHGLRPDGRLWMGWEDYLYGLLLRSEGYRQYVVTSAQIVDDYEYKQARFLGKRVVLADKPAWYMYYAVRNLLAINLHRLPDVKRAASSILWVAAMLVHVWVRRGTAERARALTCYLHGCRDGLFGRGGKWKYP